MQRMCPDIPPEPIQAHFARRRSGTRHFKHPRGDPQPSIRRYHLGTSHPLGELTSFSCCQPGSVNRVLPIELIRFLARSIRQCLRSSEMSKEVAIGGEDVKLIRGTFLVLYESKHVRSTNKPKDTQQKSTHITTKRPSPRILPRIPPRKLQGPLRNPNIEIDKHQLNRRQQQRPKLDPQNRRIRLLRLDIPPQRIPPRRRDILNLDTPRLGQPQPDIIPVIRKCETRLVRRHNGEDVLRWRSTFHRAFENSQIGNHPAGVEVLSAVVGDLVVVVCDFQVVVAGVDGAADEVVVLGDELCVALCLFGGADYVGGCGPEEVVA